MSFPAIPGSALLSLIVCAPFVGALLLPVVAQRPGRRPALVAILVTAATLALLIIRMPEVYAGELLLETYPWIDAVGLGLSFRLDGLSLLFAQLILVIGLLVLIYAPYYLAAGENGPRFYAFLLLFMGSMLGLVLSENLLLMLFFWELTSLSSFLLIGLRRHQQQARQGARLALLVTGGGGLALLAAVLLLGSVAGSLELSAVLAAPGRVKDSGLYPLILVLFLLGVFTKSAQFPFHFWLPQAMAAPTPVSAYLHSATMVKAGIFLLARFFPVLSGTEMWFYLVGTTGLVTLLLGAYVALFQDDLKGLLAYSTVSHLGLITLLFGLGTPLGLIAAVFHIVNHAVFKASLFMAAGIIDHECGSRDMRKVNGLVRYMPYTAALAMVAAGAMAGVPLLNGFLSKEMFFGETLYVEWLGEASWHWLLPVAAVVGGVLAVAYSLRFVHDVFFNGEPKGLTRTPHEPPYWMRVPVEILVVLCVVVGVFPNFTVRPVLEAASAAVLQGPLPQFSLSVWHGFNTPLVMSLIALAGGTLLYAVRRPVFAVHHRLRRRIGHRVGRWFKGRFGRRLAGKEVAEGMVEWVFEAGRRLDAAIDNRSLTRYLFLLVLVALAAGVAGYGWEPLAGRIAVSPVPADLLIGGFLLAVGVAATSLRYRMRFEAVLMLGLVGLMVSLLFARFSAPDLALTQLLIEIATVILILLAMHFLPPVSPAASRPARRRDGALALAAGAGAAALCYAMLTHTGESISAFYLAESKPGGGGTNVVNVILVDFRAFDTLGEVTVLGIAAIAIAGMLAGLLLRGPSRDSLGRPWARDAHPLVLSVVAKLILPMALLVAVWLFLRGHNEPGGGFIAGLVVGVALILQYIVVGNREADRRLGWDLSAVIGAGLTLMAATGLASLWLGYPFLTSAHGHATLPVLGTFEWASAMVFDLGVFLGVVGTLLLVLAGLGRVQLAEDDS